MDGGYLQICTSIEFCKEEGEALWQGKLDIRISTYSIHLLSYGLIIEKAIFRVEIMSNSTASLLARSSVIFPRLLPISIRLVKSTTHYVLHDEIMRKRTKNAAATRSLDSLGFNNN